MRAILTLCLVAAATGMAWAQDHHECPMMAGGPQRKSEVAHRHQAATSVPSAETAHHFLLADDGGSIRLEATTDAATETRDLARVHLRAIAHAFAAGDFSTPAQIHGQVPPGVGEMKARRASIRYSYAESPRGGTVTIATADPQALDAVHEFLRFQIADHATGDPTR